MKKEIALASAAALFFLSMGNAASAQSGGGEPAKVKCEGVNTCKGHSECKTPMNQCKGRNACKGKGFQSMTAAECEQAKARMKKEEGES